jgi:hypothetical protein
VRIVASDAVRLEKKKFGFDFPLIFPGVIHFPIEFNRNGKGNYG